MNCRRPSRPEAPWKFSNLSNVWYSTRNPSVLSVTSTNEPELDFKSLTNWNLPTNESVEVLPGHIISLTNYYTLAVNWSNPPPIAYGTPLSTNQLNATVPAITNTPAGSYTYSPTFGQVLDVGQHTLTVTFTPADTNLYGNEGATNTVELIVMPAVAPQIQMVNQSGTSFTFTCSTVPNVTYQVQYTTNLANNIWTNLGPPIVASNSTATASDSISNVQQFYRVLVVP